MNQKKMKNEGAKMLQYNSSYENEDRRLMHIESHITDDSQAQPEISANQAAASRWESN